MRMPGIFKAVGVIALAAMALSVLACDKTSQAAPQADKGDSADKTASKPNVSKAEQSAARVSKIAFVGLKDCCQCTGDRIKASWSALQVAVGDRTDIQVERLDLDVDEARATELEKLGKVMVIPGLYFLSADGKLVKLLQGEVTAAQLAELL